MNTLTYKTYFDKVYGCFLGKCIGGTAGGPAEGRKELLDYPLDESLLHKALPNDDLDLQIMWLELIEEYGFAIDERDMAKAFYDKVPYGPGEYAVFEKNYARGIYPPLSGRFNNRYYKDGMGCPIRSEIWACLFPGDAALCEKYARMDGSLDHEKDSIDAEVFLATIETALFFTNDLRGTMDMAIARVPDGKLKQVLTDTVRYYDEGMDWKKARGFLLKHYGHADCTNMYENLGFTLIALLWGHGDFRETIRLGLACGYDTDCICASAASILGILRGADKLLGEDGMTDTGLCIEVQTRRHTGSIRDLARDVCAAGIAYTDAKTTITDVPTDETILRSADAKPIPVTPRARTFTVQAVYDGDPIVAPGMPLHCTIRVQSHLMTAEAVRIALCPSEGIRISPAAMETMIGAGETVAIDCVVKAADDCVVLSQQNLITVEISGPFGLYTDTFGAIGCEVWQMYGPYLANNQDLTHIPPHESYGRGFVIPDGVSFDDVVREYHLGGVADIDRAFVDESEPFVAIPDDGSAECVPEPVYVGEDLFDLSEKSPYQGPYVAYLTRQLYSPAERKVEIAVGHTAPFKLWVNGTLVGTDHGTKWWTVENRHFHVTLHEGENVVILKCAKLSAHASYSLIYRIDGGRWRQFTDLGTIL